MPNPPDPIADIKSAPPDQSNRLIDIPLSHKAMDVGYAGRLFGSAEHAPTNIAGIVIVLLTGAVIVLLIMKPTEAVVEPFKFIIPIITSGLGFLFGKKTA